MELLCCDATNVVPRMHGVWRKNLRHGHRAATMKLDRVCKGTSEGTAAMSVATAISTEQPSLCGEVMLPCEACGDEDPAFTVCQCALVRCRGCSRELTTACGSCRQTRVCARCATGNCHVCGSLSCFRCASEQNVCYECRRSTCGQCAMFFHGKLLCAKCVLCSSCGSTIVDPMVDVCAHCAVPLCSECVRVCCSCASAACSDCCNDGEECVFCRFMSK